MPLLDYTAGPVTRGVRHYVLLRRSPAGTLFSFETTRLEEEDGPV